MDISHHHTDFGPKFRFGLWGPIFAFLTPESLYFLHLFKISERLMGHMTYFISESFSAPLGILRILIFFGFRTLSIKLQSIEIYK
jgi:hypothetical protein